MTRVPTEAFLPTGAFEKYYNHSPGAPDHNFGTVFSTTASIHPPSYRHIHSPPNDHGIYSMISPSHQSMLGQPSYFHDLPQTTRSPPIHNLHHYASSPGPAINSISSYHTSPRINPSSDASSRTRNISLASPTNHFHPTQTQHWPTGRPVWKTDARPDLGSTLSRLGSSDVASPQQPSDHLIQRLAHQNKVIREAWEAERVYLEANRRRAEEVYQEERVIMEEERNAWDAKEAEMLTEMARLRLRIHALESAVPPQTSATMGNRTVLPGASGAFPSTQSRLHNQATSASPVTTATQHASSQQQFGQPATSLNVADMLPLGLAGASRRPHFASPPNGSSQSPTVQQETLSFVALDARMQPSQSVPDFLASPSEPSENPIPVIDVQEIDPDLDGIPIKANAAQKLTFGEPSAKSSPATSPPPFNSDHHEYQPDTLRAAPMRRSSSKDQTIQVLKAEESQRRTMHAGHTPNHSLSLFPNIRTVEASTASGPSDCTTPTAGQSSAPTDRAGDSTGEPSPPEKNSQNHKVSASEIPQEIEADPAMLDARSTLDPQDDVSLKEPLMIRNIPARDELFWNIVNKKLKSVSEGRDSLPTVLQENLQELEAAAESSGIAIAKATNQLVDPVRGGDATHDAKSQEAGETVNKGSKSIEEDVPLKLKSTTNFGAPFGRA